MNKKGIHPLWSIVFIAVVIGLSEIGIRFITTTKGYIYLGNLALLFWGFLLFGWGLISLLSYFLESRWSGFKSLIWVYKSILPVGGRLNALIIGSGGIVVGLICILKALVDLPG